MAWTPTPAAPFPCAPPKRPSQFAPAFSPCPLQIIFASRTHSQLSQFVGELRRTPLAGCVSLVALGSRKASGSERLGRLQVAGWVTDGLGRRACGIEATCRGWSASAPALCAHVCVCVCMAARATAVCRWEGP
jgi:hypothetical protein